ncbi:hypothetical protein [Halobacillus salinus]|uniref:Uncharacterized protein n=1 Tax=Halobacillus salinus TaxID=192814 RepID=A0A4Z0GU52_9BACI|nr:hypothetical protein [Halobacillus salinus]TGB01110.1 hypothetical protein E4663_18335 [Halobacillus salinus]
MKQVNLRIPLTILSIGLMTIFVEAIPGSVLSSLSAIFVYVLPLVIVGALFAVFEMTKLNGRKVPIGIAAVIIVLGLALEPMVGLI